MDSDVGGVVSVVLGADKGRGHHGKTVRATGVDARGRGALCDVSRGQGGTGRRGGPDHRSTQGWIRYVACVSPCIIVRAPARQRGTVVDE